jgi:hypothetical protein
MKSEVNILKELIYNIVIQQSQLIVGSTEYKRKAFEIKALEKAIKKIERRPLFNKIFTCKRNSA